MKKLLIIFLLAPLYFVQLSAAEEGDSLARVHGIVYGESDNLHLTGKKVPLPGCVVQIFFERGEKLDSAYTVSSQSGKFLFKDMPAGRVVMRLQCLGHETLSGVFELVPGENAFLLTMTMKKEELRESKVEAEIPLMKQLHDTTFYNVGAVSTMAGDGLRKVLEQIPGFKVTDKEIYVDGVKVSRTYVNGMLIFGDDAMNAVRALNADEVTQVKVYDEQSVTDRRRGLRHSRKERVMDVVTKDKFMSLSQLGVAASGGIDGTGHGRYAGAAVAGYDSEMMNLGLVANGNNLGGDIYDMYDLSDMSDVSKRNPLKEYAENEKVILDFSRYWKDRQFGNSFTASYTFDHKYARSASRALTEYFETSSSPAMSQSDTTSSDVSVARHTFSSILSLQDTPLKSFNLGLEGSFGGETRNALETSVRQTAQSMAYGRHETVTSGGRDWNVLGYLGWTNNDAVRWRPEVLLSVDYGQNSNLSWTVDTLATSFLKRQLSSDAYGNRIVAKGRAGVSSYLLNDASRTLGLNLFAKAEYNRSKSRRMTVDEWDVEVPVPDVANSYDYTRNDVTASAVGGFNYFTAKKLNMTGEVSINEKILLDDESYPAEFSNSKSFLYPEYNLSVKIPEWSFTSSMKALSPSIEQISNRIYDTNPLVLIGGNPDLGQSYDLNADVTYQPGLKNASRGGNYSLVMAKASASCTFRPIAGRIIYFGTDTVLEGWDGYTAKAGSVLNTFSNASRPSWKADLWGYYTAMLFHRKLSVRVSLTSRYSQTSQFSGDDEIWIGDWSNNLFCSVGYKISRRLEIIAKQDMSYIYSADNMGKDLSSRLLYVSSLSLRWDIVPRLRFEGYYDIAGYEYLSGLGKDNTTQTLKAALTLKLLKDSSLKLSLQAIDLLNSGSLYESSLNASYMMQRWNPTYGRYFLLNISYVFRKKK